MKIVFILLLFLSIPLFADTSAAYPPNLCETESDAIAWARNWVNLIDQKEYHATWLEAAGIVQDITSHEQWAAGMCATRAGLGLPTSRSLLTCKKVCRLPGRTLGNFMILEYQTNFSNKRFQIETVTLMTEGRLGQWKVISYNIENRRLPTRRDTLAPTYSDPQAEAIYWIGLIDRNQYEASWKEASGLVQDITSPEQWATGIWRTRAGLGSVISRKVHSHRTLTGLPGGMRGNFMIIEYDTDFLKKSSQIETVVLMTEGPLGLWKPISYRVEER